MKKHRNIYLLITACALMFNIHLHACHESHDEAETESLPLEHTSFKKECGHKTECATCITRNVYSLHGLLLKPRQVVKKVQSSPIFLNKTKRFHTKRVFLFKELNKATEKIYSVKLINSVVLRQ